MFCPQRRSDEMRRQLGAGPHFFLAGYCGLLGLAQGLEVLVAAAERLRDRPEIKLIVVGDGPVREKLRALAREKDVPNLTFLDRRPKSEMPALLASCDVSIVPLSVRLPGTMPSKVYEALAAGTPPLVAKGCEAERLVEEFNAGRAFEPMDGQELADAIRWLADHPEQLERMRANCRQLAQRFSRDVIARRTEGVLRAVASGEALPAVEW
jgi:glycosyltransferase involved in cell wall biosynthesis